MKKRFYLYISILLALSGTACNKMLDIKPVNSMIPVSISDYESVLLGGYPRTDFFMKTELLTDNVYANLNSIRDPEKANEPWFVWAGSHLLDGVDEDPYWGQLYKSIFYANTVLDNFLGRTPDASEKEMYETVMGEAYALRAYAYFYLVNLYADVYSPATLNLPGVPMPLSAADINREGLSALVHIPAIIPGVNFFSQAKHAYFRFRVTLGVIPDVSWSKHGPVVEDNSSDAHPRRMRDTDWFPVKKGAPEMEIEIKLNSKPLTDDCTMMLTIGICYGVVQDRDDIVQVPRTGCAKVLEVG